MGYHYIARGISEAGTALTRAMEERKKQGQYAQSLRRTLSILNPERKGEFDAMGLPDLEGEQQGMALQRAVEQMQANLQAARRREQMYAFQLEEGQRKRAALDALNLRARGGGGGGGFDTEMAAVGQAQPGPNALGAGQATDPMQLLAETGNLTPEMAMELAPGRYQPGTVLEVPGAEDYVFGVQNKAGAGSFIPKAGRTRAETPLDQARRKKLEVEAKKLERELSEEETPTVPAGPRKEMEDLRAAIAEDEAAMAGGEKKRGFLNLASREANLAANRARLAVMERHYQARPGSTAAADGRGEEDAAAEAEQVRADFRAGRLTREAAVKRLRELGFK